LEKVETVTGTVVPIDALDVDTDQIIPAVWMKRIERTGYEEGLFQKWRKEPDFVLNQPERKGADILVSGPNFGCGSSREHAPWALRDYGFKAIIAPSFGDIFRNNLPNVGLVPAILGDGPCRRILDAVTADAAALVTVDVVSRTITCEAADVVGEPFLLEDGAHYRLTHGKDLIDLALEFSAQIRRHEERRRPWMPRTNGVIEATFASSGLD
jgi:3-isopropylmalate/(R)-2-methylmalate dehydratase small subunit